MGFAEALFGAENPFAMWANQNQNALGSIGAGIANGTDFGSGLAKAAQYLPEGRKADDAYATQQKAEAERQQQIADTAALKDKYSQWFMEQGQPQIAQGIADGIVEPGKAYWDFIQPKDSSEAPANIREWEEFSKFTPEQQAAYLRMKRANPYLDIGTGFVQPDPVNPGMPGGPVITKENQQEAFDTAVGGAAGKLSVERGAEAPMADVRTQMLNERTDLVVKKIDEALGQTAWDSTGMIGQVMGGIAGTKAFDLRETAKTIKANIGFAELQAMRDASPTGGALGQVAVQELDMLQSVLSSINPDQSQQQLAASFAEIKRLMERQKQFRQMAQDAKYGQGSGSPGNVTSTGIPWSVEP